MKKILSIFAVGFLFVSNTANALNVELDPYMGADFSMMKHNYRHNGARTIAPDLNALSVNFGIKTSHYVMFEGFIQRSFVEEKRTPVSKINTNHWAAGVDILGYYPVYTDLDLIAGVGVGEYRMRKDSLLGKNKKDWGHGWRYTVGGEYFMDQNWGIRATYRYINFTEYTANRADEFSIGVRYHFN